MYPYMYPAMGTPYCYWCTMTGAPIIQPPNYTDKHSMMRGEEEPEEDRTDQGTSMPGTGQMPGMGQMNMGKIQSDTQEIVRMFEQHHPEILRTLTASGMPIGQARQLLGSIVQMTLMHHMMHQM